jgi:hypothetical protein
VGPRETRILEQIDDVDLVPALQYSSQMRRRFVSAATDFGV